MRKNYYQIFLVILFFALLQGCGSHDSKNFESKPADVFTFSSSNDKNNAILNITNAKKINIDFSVAYKTLSLNQNYALNLVDSTGLYWQKNNEIMTSDTLFGASLFFNGIEIDYSEVKVYNNNDKNWVLGSVPTFLKQNVDINNTIDGNFSLSENEIKNLMQQDLDTGLDKIFFQKKVYYPYQAKLIPAYKFTAYPNNGTTPYNYTINAHKFEILNSGRLVFDYTADANLYEENSVASGGQLTTIKLDNLLNDGTKLENDLLVVKNCQDITAKSRTSDVYKWFNDPLLVDCDVAGNASADYTSINPNNYKFDALVAYYAVTRAYNWHKNILSMNGVHSVKKTSSPLWGNNWSTLWLNPNNKLNIYVRSLAKDQNNVDTLDNAQYRPMNGRDGKPSIIIGTGYESDQGSPRSLQNIGKDIDVYLHEFGHHMVFRSVTDTSQLASVSLHEGLADFFTYSITGNNKLGESVVPSSNPNGALRTGGVTGVLKNVGTSAYSQGSFLSSTLWEIREKMGVWKDGLYKTDKIVSDAVDLCTQTANIMQFLVALGQSAEVFAQLYNDNAKQLKDFIYGTFYIRGYLTTTQYSEFVKTGSIPPSTETNNGTTLTNNPQTSTSVTQSAEKPSSFCGVISNNSHNSSFNILILVPILFLLIKRLFKIIF